MNNTPKLIVMLTHNDHTVENASEIFESCKHSNAEYWGFKEKPLPISEMKSCGKTTFLEVVEYDEESGLQGARIAKECGCDILMGTVFFDSINQFCKENNIKYMPFVGQITDRPSILDGSIEHMISQAKEYLAKGVYGFDLLGYRYTGDPIELNNTFIQAVQAPVCLAGSIDSYERLDEVIEANPWAFTIGSAFFEEKFGTKIHEQINNVCNYLEK